MRKEEPKIICPIFRKQNRVIKNITNKINIIEEVAGKAVFAEKLRKEVEILLSCLDYKDTNLDCQNCRFISEIRKKTASLIIKSKNIGK